MLILKNCPKCKTGAIGFDRDQYGWYEYCIQCGYVRDLIGMVELRQKPANSVKERRRKARILGKEKQGHA